MLPYLKTKRKQAQLALKFRRTFDNENRKTHIYKHKDGRFVNVEIFKNVLQERKYLTNKLHLLNQRGIYAS